MQQTIFDGVNPFFFLFFLLFLVKCYLQKPLRLFYFTSNISHLNCKLGSCNVLCHARTASTRMRPAIANKDGLIRNDDLHRQEEHCYKNGNEMNQDRSSSSFFRLTAQRMMISIRPILNWRRCFLLLSIILYCSVPLQQDSLFFFLPAVSGSPATMTNTAALGRLVKTRYGLLRGITLQGGATQPSPPSPTGY